MKEDKIVLGIKLEPSTLRGAVWLATALIGFIMVWNGRDVSQLLLLAAGVAGGLGIITTKEEKQ